MKKAIVRKRKGVKKQQELTAVVFDGLLEVLERTSERSLGCQVLELCKALKEIGDNIRQTDDIISDLSELIEEGHCFFQFRLGAGLWIQIQGGEISSIEIYPQSLLYSPLIKWGKFEVLEGSAPPGTWGRDFRIFRYGKFIGDHPMYISYSSESPYL